MATRPKDARCAYCPRLVCARNLKQHEYHCQRKNELTPVQGKIARMIAAQMGNPEIGRRLGISTTAVEKQVWHICNKWSCENRLGIALRQLAKAPRSLKRWSKVQAERGNRGGLTQREAQVAALVVAALSNRIIAATLGIKPDTVSAHVSHIADKWGCRSRVAIAVRYVRTFECRGQHG